MCFHKKNMRCCVVFCFLFVCFVLEAVDGLKASDKGVCTVKHTATKTRPKTVVVALSKWCGKKKCTVRQTRQQKYTVVSNRQMCCNGFVYTAATDSCAPVCSTGCANGTCVDPNVCHCAPPLYLDPTTKNKCLTPVCDHPCINGQCTINNTCTCLDGNVYFNSTHCAPNCTEGYKLSSLTCIPKCEGCGNGTCVSPNVCKCFEGYSNVNGSCQPVCKEQCVNGWCSAPGVCTCDEDFSRKNATVCQRSCAGECRANGTCTVMVKPPKTRIKSYEATVPCGRGKSCPKKMTKIEKYREAPVQVEICCDLYEYNTTTDSCVPTCEDDCEGGNCVAPNVCICNPPLVLDKTTIPNKCVPPVCDNPCVNGVCTANNQCTCNDGYDIQADNFTCIAQCTNCTNGDCVHPNVCECHKGYTMNNNQCIPQCKNGCSHGFCSAPDICTCDHGYEFRNNTCSPICETSCVNADCIAPNTCGCWNGYKSKDGHKDICVPECKNDCTNGFCSSPNVCTCNLGYESVDNKCKPICEKSCVNATCVAPNTCECLEGFSFKAVSKEVCSPTCESCVHGVCIAPNRCECHKGYSREGEICEPVCEETCVNGYCSGPNECTCKLGFTKSDKPSVCSIPCVCDGGTCLDGKCHCETDMKLVNDTACVRVESSGMKAATTTGLASLQMTWWVAGAVGVLLMVLVLVSISRIWHTRKNLEQKPANNDPYGSVIYTIPNTLVREEVNEEAEEEEEREPSVNLLSEQTDDVTR